MPQRQSRAKRQLRRFVLDVLVTLIFIAILVLIVLPWALASLQHISFAP